MKIVQLSDIHVGAQFREEVFDNVVLVTLGTARPDRDEGEVGYRQNLWLERTMKRYPKRLENGTMLYVT